MLRNPGAFYDWLRANDMLGPTISSSEFEGLEALTTAARGFPSPWCAYMLATAYHETAHTMQPIREHGGPEYFRRMYDVTGARSATAKRYGNVNPGDGARYYGRGYVQLTWRVNYERASRELGVDFVGNPDAALSPVHAAKIARLGMSEGWFTGQTLRRHLGNDSAATRGQFIAARGIINARDRAALIAGYAMNFQAALQAGAWA